jgi:hypothetical protein
LAPIENPIFTKMVTFIAYKQFSGARITKALNALLAYKQSLGVRITKGIAQLTEALKAHPAYKQSLGVRITKGIAQLTEALKAHPAYKKFPGTRTKKGIAQLTETLAPVTKKFNFISIFKQEDPNSRSERGMEQGAATSGIESENSGRMKPAPNISLNAHRSSDTKELYVVAIAGIILQSSVLIFAGFTVYHPAFSRRFYKNDQPVAGYAYPLLLVGTVILVIGMVVCSAVIEKSTTETRYSLMDLTPKKNSTEVAPTQDNEKDWSKVEATEVCIQ